MKPEQYLEIARGLLVDYKKVIEEMRFSRDCSLHYWSPGVCRALGRMENTQRYVGRYEEISEYRNWMTKEMRGYSYITSWLRQMHGINIMGFRADEYRLAWIQNQIDYWEWRVENES